jgi:hypothetical protein
MMDARTRIVVICALLMSVLLGGCATRAKRVHCTGRLEPINTPAPVATEAPAESSHPPVQLPASPAAAQEGEAESPGIQGERQP